MIKRGDVFYADLNPVKGSEISKIRPVLVISNDNNNKFSNTITVIPISSAKDKNVYPFEVYLDAKEANLGKNSILKVNQIRTIDKIRLKNKVTTLDTFLLLEVEQAIYKHLDMKL